MQNKTKVCDRIVEPAQGHGCLACTCLLLAPSSTSAPDWSQASCATWLRHFWASRPAHSLTTVGTALRSRLRKLLHGPPFLVSCAVFNSVDAYVADAMDQLEKEVERVRRHRRGGCPECPPCRASSLHCVQQLGIGGRARKSAAARSELHEVRLAFARGNCNACQRQPNLVRALRRDATPSRQGSRRCFT